MRLWHREGRARGVRGAAAGGLATAVALCSFLAPAAGAKVIYDPVINKKFGILPSPAALTLAARPRAAASRVGAFATATCSTTVDQHCASPLKNVGAGPVQHAERDYLFFWGPSGSFPSNYVAGMKSFLSGLQAGDYRTGHTGGVIGNPLSVVQQYYDNSGPRGAKRFIPLAVQNGGTIMDTNAYPNSGHNCTDSYKTYNPASCVTAQDIQNEVESYIAAHHYPTGVGVEYFVLTPSGVGSCDDSTGQACAMAQYCAWHTYAITSSFQPITFANIPYLAGTPCDLGLQLNNDGTDTVVGTVSHELAETMTDPLLNAWQGSGGSSDEIGDKCAYQFIVGGSPGDVAGLPLQKPGTPSWYNAALGGRHYLLQTEFDNLANGGTGGCNQWDTQTQPKAAIAGLGWAAPGARASFSLTKVKAPAGIAYVTWSFGDGRAGSTTGTAGVSHTYQAAGKYTVTAIVTDNHGNEVKETKHMQVGPVHTLTVTRRGSGSGTIGSSPAGLSCGATCKLAFLSGAVVTLRAKATRGSRFAGWSGGCTGTTTCQVTMGTNKAVTATFEAIPPPSTTIMAAHIDRGSRKATFDFTGSGGVGRLHFECRLGSGGWSSCRSPKTYTGLKPGRHTFAVRAIDADGRADPSPKKHSFTV